MYSGKDISELVGYTSRVYSLIASLYELDSGDYLRGGDELTVETGEKVSCSEDKQKKARDRLKLT